MHGRGVRLAKLACGHERQSAYAVGDAAEGQVEHQSRHVRCRDDQTDPSSAEAHLLRKDREDRYDLRDANIEHHLGADEGGHLLEQPAVVPPRGRRQRRRTAADAHVAAASTAGGARAGGARAGGDAAGAAGAAAGTTAAAAGAAAAAAAPTAAAAPAAAAAPTTTAYAHLANVAAASAALAPDSAAAAAAAATSELSAGCGREQHAVGRRRVPSAQ